MSQTNISQSLVSSEDRRRFPRHRGFAITYLDLGDDNGGILLNLGGGGLSFQAVAKLNPGQDIALRFGLFNDGEMIAVTGRVTWLGPTRKEAGVCFAGLSDIAEQSIARWLAEQEAERILAERKTASFADSDPVSNEIHLLPSQVSATLADPKSMPLEVDLQRSSSAAFPGETHLSDSLLDHALNRAKTSPVFGSYIPPLTPTRFVSYPKEQPQAAAPSVSAVDDSVDAKQPTIRFLRTIPVENQPESRQMDQAHVAQRGAVRPSSDSQIHLTSAPAISSASPGSAAPVDNVLRAVPMLLVLQKNRRAIQVAAGVVACVGILVLLFMIASLGNHSVDDGSSTAVATTPEISAPAAGASDSVASPDPNTTAGTATNPQGNQNISQPQTEPSSISAPAATGDSDPSSLTPPQIVPQVVQRRSDSSWLTALKEALFGMEDKPTLDPVVAGVSVWADQRTGFYYCSSSPYFAKPERVSLVTQGEALQSGFQPKLGTYCY